MRSFAQKLEATQQTTSAKSTIPSRAHFGQSREVNSMLHLQRTIGNQAVQRILQTHAEDPDVGLTAAVSPRFGHDFSQISIHPPAAGVIQAKLAIGKPGDEHEQEADRVSEQVMRIPEPQLQHACACGGGCPKCQMNQAVQAHERLQTKRVQASDPGQIAAPPIVHEVLRSPGQSLDPEVRAFMEPRFGHDFSRVRVHSDAAAEQSAQSVNAIAYTVGQNIVFGAGSFAPGTGEGRRLIAHELAHVVQQSGALTGGALQRQPDPKKQDKPKTQKDVPPQPAPPPKAGLPDYAVLLAPDENFVTLATVIAPNAKILHATSVDDLAAQLKTIKGPIGTLYFVAHMIDDGSLMFEAGNTMNFVLPETVAEKIKGTVQVDSLDFRGCQAGQAPAALDKIRVSLTATKVTGGTCTLVTQVADPIKSGGKPITKPEQLKNTKVKADFEAGLKKTRELFVDNKKKCIINDTEAGYFQTGGKLIAVWANPDSMAESTAWDDTKSVCYNKLKTEKIDPTKKLPVIDPDDCKLIEVDKKQP
jgi:hypothetical protein